MKLSRLYKGLLWAVLGLTMSAAALASGGIDQFCVYNNGKIVFHINADSIDSIGLTPSKRFYRIYSPSGKLLYSESRRNIDSMCWRNNFSDPAFVISSAHQLTASYDDALQEYTFASTGGDPFIFTSRLGRTLSEDSCVLTFEYQATQGITGMQVFFGDPISEGRSVTIGDLDATEGTNWKTFSYNTKILRENFNWGGASSRFRVDWGCPTGSEFKVRGFHFRPMTAEETEAQRVADSAAAAKKRINADIAQYLVASYPDTITQVSVTDDKVIITGTTTGKGTFVLAEVTPWEDVTELKAFPYQTSITDSAFSITLDRSVSREGVTYDRVLSKWAVIQKTDTADVLASHARYADDVTPKYSAEPGVLKGKKGIAAGLGAYYYADFDSLDVHSTTMNITLNTILQTTAGGNTTPYTYGGKTYYINNSTVAGHDDVLLHAQAKGIIVSAILLCPTGSMFTDPENTGGYYSMPNMTTAEAVNAYAAVLNYLAERYSTGEHGRIHHWIMHNEVDMGTTWTNMGTQPMYRYLDRYIKSERMAYNIIRQYDQNASILGSYTHSWASGDGNYAPKDMLNTTVKYSAAEGDFLWGVAYHPYPINLASPKYWINDVSKATYSKNASFVTFQNPEVINDWILDKTNYYKGTKKRILFFSEQGTNSPSYSETDLANQAAGAALIWKKIKQLDGIDAMQWHNWMDNREEGGLRIGLRAFADGDFKDYDVKPVWKVWQAADTDKEDEVFKPYLDVIGISNWDGLIHTVN
ncbi:MAG: DUF5722 domain-containing protein [Prevotellaceae bacterium]|nr:DUF5722 domain-containing protein [Prevotellaceae bacterium]MDY3856458.1 DUF5722 domain-containing protein [Bacteroidaceae bacterium]